MRSTLIWTAAVSLALLAVGCDRAPEETPPPADTSAAPTAEELAAARESLTGHQETHQHDNNLPADHPPIHGRGDGMASAAPPDRPTADVNWNAPSSWEPQSLGPNSMRLAEYKLPAASAASGPGELAVFFFPGGAMAGGGIEGNVVRWQSQFTTPDGQPVSGESMATTQKTVNGLDVTVVDIVGTYDPGRMAGGTGPQPGSRMLGALIHTDDGLLVFKAVGPQETMAANRAAFDALVESLIPNDDGTS